MLDSFIPPPICRSVSSRIRCSCTSGTTLVPPGCCGGAAPPFLLHDSAGVLWWHQPPGFPTTHVMHIFTHVAPTIMDVGSRHGSSTFRTRRPRRVAHVDTMDARTKHVARGQARLPRVHPRRRMAGEVRTRAKRGLDDAPWTDLVDGRVVAGPDLRVSVDGLQLPNPFVIGSGPPGTNYKVMKKAFDEGWGAVIAKTVSLEAEKVHNVTPRYARMKTSDNKTLGWENIELISDRPLQDMLDEFKRLKEEFPDRVLIASIMEEYNRNAWEELIGRCEETGVNGFEINFSCPHGMPERRMGMAMGQDCELMHEVCGWIHEASTIPVWAKMTPNVTDITLPAREALKQGCQGVSAINTITSVMGINLDTLRPEPTVEGYSTPGGYSSTAVKPIALAKVMSIAQMIQGKFDGKRSLSGIGGINSGEDAAEFILCGANTVQVCTGVMVHGYPLVKTLAAGLQNFMTKHGFAAIDDFRGASLPYFTTHTELVRLQHEAIAAKKAKRTGVDNDAGWSGDGFVQESESMVSNK